MIVTATPSVSQHATPRPSRRVIDDDDDDIVTPVALTRVGSGGMSRLGASLAAAHSPRGSIAPDQSAQTARGSAAPGIRSVGASEAEVLVSATPVTATPVTKDDGAHGEADVVAAPVQASPEKAPPHITNR